MNRENKKYIPIFVAVLLLFVWMFLTVFLTGSREISDFTDTDKMIFMGFIVVELLTCAFIVFYIKSKKITNKNVVNTLNKNEVKKPIDRRRVIISVTSFVALFATMICGIISKNHFDASMENLIGSIAVASMLLPFLFLIINIVIHYIYVKMLNKKSIAEYQQYWISHRGGNSEKNIIKKRLLLKTLVWINDIYSVFLAACAFTAAFFVGVIYEGDGNVGILFACYIILSGATLRIRLKISEKYFEEDKRYISENDYPTLYGLAAKAAVETGCTTRIKIAILDDFNAGAASINNTISIQLGAPLLDVLSESELYCVLLHEFSHIKNEAGDKRINSYYRYICDVSDNTIVNIYSLITKHLFTFIDRYFNMQYGLYLYAVSLARENDADKAMLICGNNEIAASALVKIKYYELYNWEKGTYDAPSNMESEEYDQNILKNDICLFKEVAKANAEKWNVFIGDEILSRNSTHPTLKMRLANLGVNKPKAIYAESSVKYIEECERAIEFISLLISEHTKDSYAQYRKYYYIDPKELVEKWENSGKPIIAEEYGDICTALRYLGRNTEALELCESAIKLFDDVASCYAYFIKGCFLLHSFDKAGIEYIYKAIENNHNYIDEGLGEIGSFCCLTGQEDQLEIYRERAIALAQENVIYSEANALNEKDKLSTESLPDGMLDDILAHITVEYSDNIEKIYLVRKTITDNFFTSVFVIKMVSDTDNDVRSKILHKAFNYLDTCSNWQFSLFDYEDVKNVKIENIAGSCVYIKQ